jgi:hypothetical protein
MSSGGSVATAVKIAEELDSGVIVAIICDQDRYLSSIYSISVNRIVQNNFIFISILEKCLVSGRQFFYDYYGKTISSRLAKFKKIPKRKYDTAKATSSKERVVWVIQ